MSINALILLDFLASRRQQQQLYLQILKDESKAAERSYNLVFNQTYRRNRGNLFNFSSSTENEMTGILSSLSNLTTRRSTPSFSTPPRTTFARGEWPSQRSPIQRTTRATNTINNEIIPPTQAEIEISTITCKYSDCSTNQTMCAIARRNFENDDEVLKIIHCGHVFIKTSLLRWFETNRTCPVCRHEISSPARRLNPNRLPLFSTR